MTVFDAVALILFLGVIAYAVLGGADFGSGIWDLTAGNAKKGGRLRKLVDHAIGPVWEANHTWLIFVLVFMWTGFPVAFAGLMQTLYVPFLLAGLGIVFRGAAFAFRKFAPTIAQARLFGAMFAISSVITPFFFGAIAGAIASGRVPIEGAGDPITSWTGPASLIGGTLAVLTCAFLAAVFLTAEAARGHDQELIDYCRRRALGTGLVAGVAVLAFLIPLEQSAPTLFDGLTSRALPIIAISAIAGAATIFLLYTRRFRASRLTAVTAVAAVVGGWGVGQYPWLLVDQITIADAAGATASMWALIGVFILSLFTVFPALGYLYWITQKASWAEADNH